MSAFGKRVVFSYTGEPPMASESFRNLDEAILSELRKIAGRIDQT